MKPGIKTIIAGGLLLVGAVFVPLGFVLPIVFAHTPEKQFKIPGKIEVTVTDPGRYYLWNDYQTVFNGKSYERPEKLPGGIEIRVWKASGSELEFVSDMSISSADGSSSKHSIGYVEVEQPGKLEIEVSGVEEEGIFSFAKSRIFKILGWVAGGIAAGLLVGAAAVGLIIWGVIKLLRSNRVEARPGI